MPKRSSKEFWTNLLEKRHESKSSRFITRLPNRVQAFCLYIRCPQIIWYYLLHPKEERHSYYDHPQPDLLLAMLKANGLPVFEFSARTYFPEFQSYLKRTYEIYKQANYFRIFDEKGYFFEKALEHHLSIELLELCNKDVLLDVGSWNSPFAVIAEREKKCIVYSQDLIFTPGVHGTKIGSDVRHIPMPDGSFTKIVAHCAIDNFEEDADIWFIREAWRLLRPGGFILIIPLHMATRFENVIDPFEKEVKIDPEAIRVCKPLCGFRFGRHYDVKHLQIRLLNVVSFHPQIFYFKDGFQAFHLSCHLRFALKLVKDSHDYI